MNWDQSRLTNLRALLAELYPREVDQRRLVGEVGLRQGAISFDASADNSWFNILRYANQQNRVDALLDLAINENSGNELLKRARDERPSSQGPGVEARVAQIGSEPRPVRVLLLSANPRSTAKLRLDLEVRKIEEKLRASKHSTSVQVISRWAVRVDDLLQALLDVQPDVVHFSGHGTKAQEILLEDDHGNEAPAEKEALAELFNVLKDRIRVVVLNACYSHSQAEAVAEHIDCTIGMNDQIPDDAAIEFAATFYQAIGFGRSVQTAFDLGVSALKLKKIAGAGVPNLIPRKGVSPGDVFPVIS